MYANRKDARTERINLSATPEARERISRIAEKHGEQMTAWLYSYVMEKLEEDFGSDSSFAPL